MCEGVSLIFELNSTQKNKRKKILGEIRKNLKERDLWVEPFADMAERYMEMWDTCLELEYDIKTRGVQIYNEKTGFKKNDSVALLTNLNKQMLILLDKLGINTSQVKFENGKEI